MTELGHHTLVLLLQMLNNFGENTYCANTSDDVDYAIHR